MRYSCVPQTALPRHLLKRQRKKIEELAELAAHDLDHQDTAEYLVGILDHYEPDPDLEPWLGGIESSPGPTNQLYWAMGNRDDRERETDDEPELGWSNPWSGPWTGGAGDWQACNERSRGVVVDARPELHRLQSILSRKEARS